MKLGSIILICAVAAGCGWGLGRWTQGPEENQAEAERAIESAPVDTKTARRSSRQSQLMRRNIEAVAGAMGEAEANREQLARKWAGRDPEQFLAWILRVDPQPDAAVLKAFFEDWVHSDPEAAFEAVLALPRQFDGKQQQALTRMLGAALKDDWRVGIAWVERVQKTGAGYDDNSWLEKPTLEMGEAIARLPLGGPRDWPEKAAQNMLQGFAMKFSQQDFEAARKWALTLPPEGGQWALLHVLREWAKRDLPGALDYLANEAPSGVRQNQAVVIRAYASREPQAALAWAEAHMGVPGASDHVLRIWMADNQRDATSHVLGLEDPQQRAAYLGIIAESRMDRGPPQHFYDWLEPLSREHRVAALEQAAVGIAQSAPPEKRESFQEYVAALPEEEISDTLIERMQRGMSGRGPSSSLTWAASLPADRAVHATENIVTAWASSNREEARAAVNELPAGHAREAAERILNLAEEK